MMGFMEWMVVTNAGFEIDGAKILETMEETELCSQEHNLTVEC